VKQKSIAPERARRMQAVILTEWARIGAADAVPGTGGLADPLTAAREAVKRAPDLVPARVLMARLLARNGSEKAAAKTIEQGWAPTPHPALAAAYAALRPAEEPVARVRRFEKLAALNPQHRESHLALAEAALAAALWGEARGHLAKVAEAERTAPPPGSYTARLCRLMARLEEAESGDPVAVRRWLMLAADASADPAWTCAQCGTATADWQARCGHCGAFDSLAWRAAPRPTAQALALAPAEATAPGTVSVLAPAPAILGAAATPTGALELGGPSAPPTSNMPAASSDADAEAEAGAGVDAARLVN
jgi:HemY protein